jgi:hypothetical protein
MEAITMLRTRIKAGVLISGGAAIALMLGGCSGGDTASPDVPDISSSSTAQPQPTTTTPPTSTSTAQAQQPAQPAPNTQAASGECKVADLNLSLSEGEGTAGTYYRSLIFTNKGTRTCTIQGFAGVSYVAGDDGHQVGPAAERVGEKGPAITLEPGDSAFADIGFVQVRNYDPNQCQPTETRGLRVYPPHEYDSMFVPAAGTGCAAAPPGNQLTVSTVRAGTGPA